MFRSRTWIAVCLMAGLVSCRSLAPVGRAKVISEPSLPTVADRQSDASDSSDDREGYWHSSSSNVRQTSATNPQSIPDDFPVVTDPRTPLGRPDLSAIYRRASLVDDRQRNPIIVIPGILGSKLVDHEGRRVVWGEFGGNGIDPATPDGARLLALPLEDGKSLIDLEDEIQVEGPLDALNVRVFGVPFQISAYRDILSALGYGGYRDSTSSTGSLNKSNQYDNCFQFAYDWRRDNVETAALLHEFILEKKAYVEEERRRKYGDDAEPVRFDIVAHSMGGVMARYYLQYGNAPLPDQPSPPQVTWAGAKYVERLVMVAPPNAGSLQAVEYLTQGVQFSRFFSRYEPAILGTMPSIYQLLPRTRHRPVVAGSQKVTVDLYDPKTWVQARWGFFNPSQAETLKQLVRDESDPQKRLRIAYDHLAKCLYRAELFHAAIDVKTSPPEGTTIHLIASDAHPTMLQYSVDHRGALTPTARAAGDGIVTRHSALMDERLADRSHSSPRLRSPIKWESVNFLFTDHLGMTKDPAFTDNVLYLLLEAPRQDSTENE